MFRIQIQIGKPRLQTDWLAEEDGPLVWDWRDTGQVDQVMCTVVLKELAQVANDARLNL